MTSLHTVIIWQSGFKHLSEILWELNDKFQIKYAEKIIWPNNEIHKQLNKLYINRNFTKESKKVEEVGGNQLIVLLVTDLKPVLEDEINENMADYKLVHRQRGANYLHTADNEEESYYNFYGLTGRSRKDFDAYKKSINRVYVNRGVVNNPELVEIEKPEFNTLNEVFEQLNKYENWAILRNWEELGEGKYTLAQHGDLDILVTDYFRTLTILASQARSKEKHRVHQTMKVGSDIIPLDVRYLGDNYYDKKWEEQMLQNRVKEDLGFYRLANQDYFWSLLYHGLFQKPSVAEDYKEKLNSLNAKEQILSPDKITDLKVLTKHLKKYLRKNKISITKPRDTSVYFSHNTLTLLKRKYNSLLYYLSNIFYNIKPLYVDLSYLAGVDSLKKYKKSLCKARKFKKGVFGVDNIIIKEADEFKKFLFHNEAKWLKQLTAYNYFPKVVDYFEKDNKGYLIISKFEGKTLLRKFKLAGKKAHVFKDSLQAVVDILEKEGIKHHDIRPHNIIVNKKGLAFLIDFQFANFSKIEAHNNLEQYLLDKVKPSLGGRWYDKKNNDEQTDAKAVKIIIKDYCSRRSVSAYLKDFILFLKNYLVFLKYNRLR